MIIARYKENSPETTIGKYYKFSVEIFVIVASKNKRVQIAAINCKDEEELKFAAECCDYLVKGE